MTKNQAISTVFWTAFHALPKIQRDAVLSKLLNDEQLLEDIKDIFLIRKARKEKGRNITIEEYVKTRKVK